MRDENIVNFKNVQTFGASTSKLIRRLAAHNNGGFTTQNIDWILIKEPGCLHNIIYPLIYSFTYLLTKKVYKFSKWGPHKSAFSHKSSLSSTLLFQLSSGSGTVVVYWQERC